MTFWTTIGLVTTIAFFGTRAGSLLYWRIHKKHLGGSRPTWREAFGEAWSALIASTTALAMYLAGKG